MSNYTVDDVVYSILDSGVVSVISSPNASGYPPGNPYIPAGSLSLLSNLSVGTDIYPVTSIGNNAFQNCTKLTSVSFGQNSQLKSIGNSVFDGCSSLQTIIIPSLVSNIGQNAFQYSGLKTVYISSSSQNISGTEYYSGSNTTFFGAENVDIYSLVGKIEATLSTGDNLLESTSGGVGAFAGVLTATGLAALLNKRNNHNVLKLAAGVGAGIGTTLNGFLKGDPSHKMVENGVVGLAGAMAGYACGQHINEGYPKGKPANTELKQESPNFYDALSNAGFSGLVASLFISGKQMARGVGACKPPYTC